MLTTNQLRQIAARSGARDIGIIEIDVLLTHILQLFSDRGVMAHLAFKAGTMLRKMVFGPRGRISTDLDFTRRTDIHTDDLVLSMLESLAQPYHGISFRFDREKDWYMIEEGCAAVPVCSHAANERGVKFKLQPVGEKAQIDQDYFRPLPFEPAAIPCLAFEGIVAEKIRALAVLKLWNSGGPAWTMSDFAPGLRIEPTTISATLRISCAGIKGPSSRSWSAG